MLLSIYLTWSCTLTASSHHRMTSQGNKVFDKLSCGNMAVHHIYYKRFAEVISSVIRRYIALIGECMDEFLMDLPLVGVVYVCYCKHKLIFAMLYPCGRSRCC